LLSEALGILLSALLRLLALEGQVVLERLGVPAGVGSHDLVVPVGLDGRLEVLAVRGAGVRDAVVAEPALKLRLVPLVVDCFLASVYCCMTPCTNQTQNGRGCLLYAPALPNQLLAVAVAASVTTRVDVRENLMMCGCLNID
jgi:hypothetical protein